MESLELGFEFKVGRFSRIVTLLKLLYLYDAHNMHVDIHMIYGHRNGMPRFVNNNKNQKSLSKEKSPEPRFELRVGRQRIPGRWTDETNRALTSVCVCVCVCMCVCVCVRALSLIHI